MIRPTLAVVLALLAPGVAAAADSGGVVLSPEAAASESQIIGQVAATLQQLRGLVPATTGATIANQAASQDDAAARSSVMAQESGSRQSQLAIKLWGRQPAIQLIDNSLTVNAADSPVTIGNGNVISQTVSTSTAISQGGNASAEAAVTTPAVSERVAVPGGQSASRQTTSTGGGTAQAISSNSGISPL